MSMFLERKQTFCIVCASMDFWCLSYCSVNCSWAESHCPRSTRRKCKEIIYFSKFWSYSLLKCKGWQNNSISLDQKKCQWYDCNEVITWQKRRSETGKVRLSSWMWWKNCQCDREAYFISVEYLPWKPFLFVVN